MSTTSLSTVAAIGRGLRGAMQWRLWVLWALVTLACALLAALPAWGWLGALLLGLGVSSLAAMALAWGRVARLYAMAALATDMHARR